MFLSVDLSVEGMVHATVCTNPRQGGELVSFDAAEALKMTSKDLLEMKVIDDVVREPLGGAHRDHHATAGMLKMYLRNQLRELTGTPIEELLEARYQRFRRMGVFLERSQVPEPHLYRHGQEDSEMEPVSAVPRAGDEAVDTKSS